MPLQAPWVCNIPTAFAYLNDSAFLQKSFLFEFFFLLVCPCLCSNLHRCCFTLPRASSWSHSRSISPFLLCSFGRQAEAFLRCFIASLLHPCNESTIYGDRLEGQAQTLISEQTKTPLSLASFSDSYVSQSSWWWLQMVFHLLYIYYAYELPLSLLYFIFLLSIWTWGFLFFPMVYKLILYFITWYAQIVPDWTVGAPEIGPLCPFDKFHLFILISPSFVA